MTKWLTLEQVHAMARHRGLDPDNMPFPLFWYLDRRNLDRRKRLGQGQRFKAGPIEETMDRWQERLAEDVERALKNS